MSERDQRYDQPGEAQFYDDLSLFIIMFKKIVAGVEQLAVLVQSGEDCSDHLNELKCSLNEQEVLVDQYSYPLSSQSPHRNTYFRFICRLLETISPLRNHTQTKEDVDLFVEFANKVQMSIGSLKGQANIGKMFRRIFALTLKLCLRCEQLLTKGSAQVAMELLQSYTEDEAAQSEPRNLMVRTAHNSESIFKKAMIEVNCRFSSLSCLDIDYNFFKTDYFLARSQKGELNATFLDRNGIIFKTIALYSRKFQEYLKRKQKANLRKTRFREVKEISNNRNLQQSVFGSPPKNIKKSFDVREITIRKREMASMTAKMNANHSSIRRETLSQQAAKEEGSELTETTQAYAKTEAIKRKSGYHVKNIYLTLSKINTTFIPLVQQSIQPFLYHQTSSSKEKPRKYPALKPNDNTIKMKTLSPDKIPTPMLEIRRCEIKSIPLAYDQPLRFRETTQRINMTEPLNKIIALQKKNVSERRNIRIMQIVNKSHMVEFDREMGRPCEKMDFLSSYNPEDSTTVE